MQFITIPGCFHYNLSILKKNKLLRCLSWIKIINHFSNLLRKKPADYFPVGEGVGFWGYFFILFGVGLVSFSFGFLVLFWGLFFPVCLFSFWWGFFVAVFLYIWGAWAENGIPFFPIVFPAEISALPVLVEKYLDVRFLLASANVKMWVMYQWPWYASRGSNLAVRKGIYMEI